MDQAELVRVLEISLSRQLTWIGAADSRVAFIFALNTAMLGVLAAVAPTTVAEWTILSAVVTAFSTVFAGCSLLALSFACFPRTAGPKNSLVYFGGIAQRDTKQFHDAIVGLTVDEYVADLSAQVHRNAEIAFKKFYWVQRALICLYAVVIPWSLAFYLLYSERS